jgi:hypothetical protein
VEWSGFQVPGSPFKVNITTKGNSDKVKVEGPGLRGGFVGQELRAVVDTTDAGNGSISLQYLKYFQTFQRKQKGNTCVFKKMLGKDYMPIKCSVKTICP